MNNKNNPISKVILFSVIFLIIGGVAGYFIGTNNNSKNFNNINLNGPNGDFPQQFDEETISEITSFFNSTQDSQEIKDYCQSNLMYCMEYCRNINPSHEVCNELNASFKGRMPAR
jgi:hypothetical protein